MSSKRSAIQQHIRDLASSDAETRKSAVYGLRYSRSKRALDALIQALDDPETKVREAATSVIEHNPRAIGAVPRLIELLKDKAGWVRFHAAGALGEIGDPCAVEPLIGLLRDGDDLFRSAAKALCKLGDRRALQPLIEELGRTEDELDRGFTWYDIGKLGCASEVRHLSHLLHTPGWTVRPSERLALLEPPTTPVRRLPPQQVARIEADIEELASADEDAAWRAVSRLGRRRGQVVEYLAEATASPNSVVRHLALHTLDRVGDPRAYPVVLEMTQDSVYDTRWCALRILGELGAEKAVPVLVAVLMKPNADAAEEFGVKEGLRSVGKPAIPALVEVLQSGSTDQRMVAAGILSEIGDEAVIAPLSTLLSNADPDTREQGIDELGWVGEHRPHELGQQCLALIEPMREDPETRVRENAAFWRAQIERAMAAGTEHGK